MSAHRQERPVGTWAIIDTVRRAARKRIDRTAIVAMCALGSCASPQRTPPARARPEVPESSVNSPAPRPSSAPVLNALTPCARLATCCPLAVAAGEVVAQNCQVTVAHGDDQACADVLTETLAYLDVGGQPRPLPPCGPPPVTPSGPECAQVARCIEDIQDPHRGLARSLRAGLDRNTTESCLDMLDYATSELPPPVPPSCQVPALPPPRSPSCVRLAVCCPVIQREHPEMPATTGACQRSLRGDLEDVCARELAGQHSIAREHGHGPIPECDPVGTNSGR